MELGLKEVKRQYVYVELTTAQRTFYDLLKSAAKQELANLSRINKSQLRNIGRSVVKLLQFVSNPCLLEEQLAYSFSQELAHAIVSGDSAKVNKACSIARLLASKGQKSVIWTYYRNNVEIIANRLIDLGADYIHGGTPSGSADDTSTREGKIKRFLTDKYAMVLVVNPAAASEGMSLHTGCHYAIYVDRNFNAGQYIQSEDRIHRLGLPPDIDTNVIIIRCKDTVDDIVDSRLKEKINRMAKVLDDSSLNIEALDSGWMDDESGEFGGLDSSDIDEILSYLRG